MVRNKFDFNVGKYLRLDDSLGSPVSGDLFLGRFDLYNKQTFDSNFCSLTRKSVFFITFHCSDRCHYYQHRLFQKHCDRGFSIDRLGMSFHFRSSVHFFLVNVHGTGVLWMCFFRVTNVLVYHVFPNDANVLLSGYVCMICFQCL